MERDEVARGHVAVPEPRIVLEPRRRIVLPDGDGYPGEFVIVGVRGCTVEVYVLVLTGVLFDARRVVRPSQRQSHVFVPLRSLDAEEHDGQVHSRAVEREALEPFHVRRDVVPVL